MTSACTQPPRRLAQAQSSASAPSAYHHGRNPFTEVAPPAEPGRGFRFVRVGELIRSGDEFFSHASDGWVRSEHAYHVVVAACRNRYRRRAR